jgi:hypothetical protein
MRKILIVIVLIGIHSLSSAQVTNTMSIHNSCVTAFKVCLKARITTTSTPAHAECEDSLVPQYFKFDMYAAGNIALNTFGHTGTYTLYGPMSDPGISSCQQISVGQVNQVSGSLSGAISIAHLEGYYVLRVNPTNCIGVGDSYKVDISVDANRSKCDQEIPCKDCLSSFSPSPGKYLVSAWVKGEAVHKNSTYQNPGIAVSFVGASDSSYFIPSGLIIDEWQRIDGIVTVPPSATDIKIGLYCNAGQCLFDDVRFIPIDASMISYVYDPVTLKLVAQLDERNYAVFYEYDEQGKLIRTKIETERGILTTQENRDNIYNK